MENPRESGDNLAQVKDRVLTINGGKAKGKLLGGNLSVLTAMVGSEYLPDFKNNILFLEEVGEEILDDHIKLLGIPAWYGSMIGHIENKFTIPLGVEAEIDADNGRISLLEPAVS